MFLLTKNKHPFSVTAWGFAAAFLFGQTVMLPVVQAEGPFIKGRECIHAYSVSLRPGTENQPCIFSHEPTVPDGVALFTFDVPTYKIHPETGQCTDGRTSMVIDLVTNPEAWVENIPLLDYDCDLSEGLTKFCLGECPQPRGYNGCNGPFSYDPDLFGCTEQDGNAIFTDPSRNGTCPFGVFNDNIVYTSILFTSPITIDLKCFEASCSNGVDTVVGATCAEISGLFIVCWNLVCSQVIGRGGQSQQRAIASTISRIDWAERLQETRKRVGNENRDLLTTSTDDTPALFVPSDHHPAMYHDYANKCGHVHYQVSLFVNRHFYAIASPNKEEEEDGATACPIIITEAKFKDDETHYHKVVWFAMDQQEVDNLLGHPNSVDDSLSVGTFELEDLRRAHESIDPTKLDKKAYDIVVNNCADYMLALAAALRIPIDSRITSYVTRRLLQVSGKELVDKIRSSVHFGSLFLDDKSYTMDGGGNRNLRGEDGDSIEDAEPRSHVVVDDEDVIQALVQARVANRIV